MKIETFSTVVRTWSVMVSMNEDSCHWTGEVPAGRVKGRTIKWVSKIRGRDICCRNIGLVQDLYFEGQTFTLETYAHCTPTPNILPKEANRVLQPIIDY